MRGSVGVRTGSIWLAPKPAHHWIRPLGVPHSPECRSDPDPRCPRPSTSFPTTPAPGATWDWPASAAPFRSGRSRWCCSHFRWRPIHHPRGGPFVRIWRRTASTSTAARARLRVLLDEVGLPWNQSNEVQGYNTSRAQGSPSVRPTTLQTASTHFTRCSSRGSVENQNVYDINVLEAVATEAGLDAAAARAAIEGGTHRDEVHAWSRAPRCGAGCAHVHRGGQALAGAQPVEAPRKLVSTHRRLRVRSEHR